MVKKRNLLRGGFLAFSLMHLARAQSAGTTGLTSSQFKRGQKKEFQAINDFETSNWIEKTDTPPPAAGDSLFEVIATSGGGGGIS